MIAKHVPMNSVEKSSFIRLVDYITDNQSKEQRLGEVSITNCIAHDCDIAAWEILATQQLNTRTKSDKTYHLLVSFRPDENPDAETLKAIEAKLCEGLGFAEHQRISAVHRDTDNLHIHIAINKIHPERLTIHEPYYPYKKLAKLCAQLEQEYGLQVDNHEPKRTVAEGRALDMEHHSGIESLTGWIQRNCLADIKATNSWQDLHKVLQKNGLQLKKRGNGLVFEAIKTGVQVKASTVARELSKAKLENRLGALEEAKWSEAETREQMAKDNVIDATEAFQKNREHHKNNSNHSQKPVRQYEKKPMPTKMDTSKLYERYQKDRQQSSNRIRERIEKLKAEKQARIDDAWHSARSRRQVIRFLGGGRFLKSVQYQQVNHTLRRTIQDINADYRERCNALYQENRRSTWADWLKAQAERGDTEALAALRARKAPTTARENCLQAARSVVDDTPLPRSYGVVAGMQGYRPPTHFAQGSPAQPFVRPAAIDSVTKKGTVIYRAGVRDCGNRIQLPPDASPPLLHAALRLACACLGGCLQVVGSLAFKARAILAASSGQVPVTFADPILESRRQRLSQSQGENLGNAEHKRGQPGHGRTAGHTAERELHRYPYSHNTAIRRRERAFTARFGLAPTRELAETFDPYVRGHAKAEPPVARDRMRGMSGSALAGLKTGTQMLLPLDVSNGLRQQTRQPDYLLRWGSLESGGVKSAEASQTQTQAKAATEQGSEQSRGRGR